MTRTERHRHAGHRGGRLLSRGEITTKIGAALADIESLAPHMFILGRDKAGPPIFDHAGRAIRAVIGSHPRGKVFYDYWTAEARETLESFFDVSARSRLAFRLLSIAAEPKSAALAVEIIVIPVTDAAVGKSRFVGFGLVRGGRAASAQSDRRLQRLQAIAFMHDATIGQKMRHSAPP